MKTIKIQTNTNRTIKRKTNNNKNMKMQLMKHIQNKNKKITKMTNNNNNKFVCLFVKRGAKPQRAAGTAQEHLPAHRHTSEDVTDKGRQGRQEYASTPRTTGLSRTVQSLPR